MRMRVDEAGEDGHPASVDRLRAGESFGDVRRLVGSNDVALVDGDGAIIDIRSGHGDDGAVGDDDVDFVCCRVSNDGDEERECEKRASKHGEER